MSKLATLTGLCFIACCLIATVSAQVARARSGMARARSGRLHVKTLRVSNGGSWGNWHYADFCARGTYAIGYSMKIERKQGRGNDTSLNGVRLICGTTAGIPTGSYASSSTGPWGDWYGEVRCIHGQVISGFRLQVEPWQRRGDDTAANFMRVRCRDFGTSSGQNERYMGSGYGFWGNYGYWSNSCSAYTAVCGIRTKIEGPQGRGDDTSLNDIQLFCCRRD